MSEKKEKKERFSQVSNEVAEKARSCKTHEELMQLLKDNSIELTPRQMEIVAGGGFPVYPDDRAEEAVEKMDHCLYRGLCHVLCLCRLCFEHFADPVR